MSVIKRPNGTGGVRKLSGRRRKPYQAVVSDGYIVRNNKLVPRQVSLGCYETRKEALAALGEWQNGLMPVDLRNATVKDAYERLKCDFTDSMAKSMQSVYNHYKVLENEKLTAIKTHTIESVPLPKLSAKYHSMIRMFWHRIFMWGIGNDIIQKDYSEFIKFHETKEKQTKTILMGDEIDECMTVKLYRILLYTGMRINELLTMETSQVYEEDGILCFHILNAKTDAGRRIIPVHSAIIKDIDLNRGYVITPKQSYVTVNREFKRFIEEHGLSQHTLHDFRRTFASYAKSCGMDEYYRKCLLGHTHGNVTDDYYTKAFVEDLKEQIELVDFCNKRLKSL